MRSGLSQSFRTVHAFGPGLEDGDYHPDGYDDDDNFDDDGPVVHDHDLEWK